MKNEEQEIMLKSYSNIWKVERRLEHINGVKIPSMPIEHALYYLGCLFIEGMFIVIIPPFRHMPILMIFGIPYLISTLLKKVKLDGKNPLKFFGGLIKYMVSPKTYVRFRPVKSEGIASYNGLIGYRRNLVIRRDQHGTDKAKVSESGNIL